MHVKLHLLCSCALLAGCVTDTDDSELEQDVGLHLGVDYSWSHPSLDVMHANGYTFVSRYLSYTAGKNISAGEAAALRASGFDIALNWETSTTAPLLGYNRGVSDAQAAAWEAGAIGAP